MKKVRLRPIMNDHMGIKLACRQEMGNNEFSWSGLKWSGLKQLCTAIKTRYC